MSGKGSRERRKEAVKLAREAVYSAKGDATLITNPFTDERCSRIFEQYVRNWMRIYHMHDNWSE